jgi:hypothetical protein
MTSFLERVAGLMQPNILVLLTLSTTTESGQRPDPEIIKLEDRSYMVCFIQLNLLARSIWLG